MIILFIIVALLYLNAWIGGKLEGWIKAEFLEQGQRFTKSEERLIKHLWFIYIMPIHSYEKYK